MLTFKSSQRWTTAFACRSQWAQEASSPTHNAEWCHRGSVSSDTSVHALGVVQPVRPPPYSPGRVWLLWLCACSSLPPALGPQEDTECVCLSHWVPALAIDPGVRGDKENAGQGVLDFMNRKFLPLSRSLPPALPLFFPPSLPPSHLPPFLLLSPSPLCLPPPLPPRQDAIHLSELYTLGILQLPSSLPPPSAVCARWASPLTTSKDRPRYSLPPQTTCQGLCFP